ncbi:MAG: hypothetical protein IID59_01770 [Proteobacteria bacterium]|nr:hypothetical protein [Pseudomonadota bacterium]
MTNLFSKTFLALALIAIVSLTSGCDPEWAKTMDTGRVQPDFRFRVVLSAPSEKRALYERMKSAAHSDGMTEYRGKEITDASFSNRAESKGFDWFPGPTSRSRHRVALMWRVEAGELPSEILVIVYNDGMDDFDAADWIKFREWREVVLPTAFPGAAIEVLSHPAKYTNKEQLSDISSKTGISIPEKYLTPKDPVG